MDEFKNKVLEFINELLALFEDKNKIVYRRLIHYHHQVQNRLDENDLYVLAMRFVSQHHVHEMTSTRNHKIMKNTPMELDVELLWESCTPQNKSVIWKWVDVIMETLNPLIQDF